MLRRYQVFHTATGNWRYFFKSLFLVYPTLTHQYLLFTITKHKINNNPKLEQNPD